MIRINLLSPENIKKEEPKEIIALAVVVMVLFVSAGIIQYVMKLGAYAALEGKISKTQTELNKYESIVKQVEALQATKNVLETKKNVINNLMAGRLIYPRMMEELLQLLPSNIWFTNLDTQLSPDLSMKLTVTAQSLDVYSIADLITSLSSSGNFANVEIGSISTSLSDPKRPVSNFTLAFTYKRQLP